MLIAKTRVIRALINIGGKYIPVKSQHKAIATAKRRVVTMLLYFKEYFIAIKRSKQTAPHEIETLSKGEML